MEGRILGFNTSTAHVWGQLVAAWDKKGINVPSLDSQLAATAHRHNLTMVTRNISDFHNTGVRLFNPFAPWQLLGSAISTWVGPGRGHPDKPIIGSISFFHDDALTPRGVGE